MRTKGCKKTNGCPFGKKCFIANYISIGGIEKYNTFKKQLIDELNSLKVEGMPYIQELYPLNGALINLEYKLSNGNKVKYLNDNEIYLGNQLECVYNDSKIKKYFGIVINISFIIISEYEENGTNPELILYKKR